MIFWRKVEELEKLKLVLKEFTEIHAVLSDLMLSWTRKKST